MAKKTAVAGFGLHLKWAKLKTKSQIVGVVVMNIGGFSLSESLLRLNNSENENLLKKLATAKRINSAADDAAGLQIANRLTQINGATVQGERNVYDGISLAMVADQGLQGISDGLNEIDRLAVQAGNGLLTSSDRQALQKQADAIAAGIQDQIKNTEFGGIKLFDQDGKIGIATGSGRINIQTQDLQTKLTDSGAFSVDLSSATNAADSLSKIRQSSQLIDNNRTDLGATQNALSSAGRNLSTQNVNQQAALSRIQDLDFAKAASEQAQSGVREQASIAVAAQGRVSQQQALQLLG